MARIKGLFFYYFIPVRKSVAYKNIKLAFPEKSESEIKSIIRGSYINVLTVISEFFWLRRLNKHNISRLMNPDDLIMITEKLKEGKGLVIVSAHFGNWELTAYGCSLLVGEPFNVIVKEQTNRLVDRRINRVRTLRGNRVLDMNLSVRDVLYLLRHNKIIAMLGDQSAPKDNSVKVKFFIDDVPAFEGAARIAIKTGANVVFGASVRRKDGTYKVIMRDVDISKYNEHSKEDVRKLTQEHVDILVELIKQYPDHWLWFHKKFKHVIEYQ
jgi:KDO2-lipid IV(A) lauroyltransferase